MKITSSSTIIDIYDNIYYDPASSDNVVNYDDYYASGGPQQFILTQHGIKVTNINEEITKQVCIAAFGGKTGVHEHCFVLRDKTLTLCCGNSVFNLTLPDLRLCWKTKADTATCFEIFGYKGNFIIHGELGISRVDDKGQIVWQFSGTDVFTIPTSRNTLEIKENIIHATNWEGASIMIDADTGISLNNVQ